MIRRNRNARSMKEGMKILLVGDHADEELVSAQLRQGGLEYVLRRVIQRSDFFQVVASFSPDLVLASGDFHGLSTEDVLGLARNSSPDLPVIIVVGEALEEWGANMIKAGAADYVLKERRARLVPAVHRAVREIHERKQRREAESLLEARNAELRRQNDALQKSEERFRQLAESVHEVFWMTDVTKTKMLYISPGYESVWGRSCQSLYDSPKAWLEAIHPEDRARVLEAALTRQINGGYDEEYRILRPDGSLRWIQDRAFPIQDTQGEVYRIAGIAEDITDRKQAQAQLTILAHAVESTVEMICITDMQDRITFANRAFKMAYGYTESELAGKTPDILLSPRNPPGLLKLILEQTRAGGWHGEVMDQRKDGTEFPVFLSTSPIRDGTGRMLGLMGVARDITELKRAEKQTRALSLLGQRLSATMTPKQAATIILDIAADLLGWDSGYVHMYSESEDAITRLLTLDTIDGEIRETPPPRVTRDPTPVMRLVMKEGPKLINADDPMEMMPFGNTRRRSATRLYAPIYFQAAVVGIISVQSYRAGTYDQEDLKVLEVLAGHCGGALQRIKAIEDLARADREYRKIFENATEGIFRTTPDGRYLSANPALARMFGFETPEQLISSVRDIDHQTYVVPERRAELKRLLEQQPLIQGFEAQRVRRDGSRFWITVNAHAVRDESGAIIYYEGTNQDITERKRAEAVVRESERKLRLIVENTREVFFLYDMKRALLYVNPALEALTGYPVRELESKGFINWVHPEDQQRMLALWEELFVGKGYSEVEFRIVTKDGVTKWSSGSWGPIYDDSGRQIGVQGVERDVSERKRLEREVTEIASNERRRIGYELHDSLCQLLAGIAFRAKVLEQTLSADVPRLVPDAADLVSLLRNAISHTRSLARGLDPVEVESVGLPAALQNLAAETEKVFSIVCSFNCPNLSLRLAPQSSLELFRIVQEAIHNAIAHGQARKIDIELASSAEEVCVRVQDDGSGFEIGQEPSTGMGLRVMNYRARSIGATLQVRSKTGHGTQMVCSLSKASNAKVN